jgi:hypothetical protein
MIWDLAWDVLLHLKECSIDCRRREIHCEHGTHILGFISRPVCIVEIAMLFTWRDNRWGHAQIRRKRKEWGWFLRDTYTLNRPALSILKTLSHKPLCGLLFPKKVLASTAIVIRMTSLLSIPIWTLWLSVYSSRRGRDLIVMCSLAVLWASPPRQIPRRRRVQTFLEADHRCAQSVVLGSCQSSRGAIVQHMPVILQCWSIFIDIASKSPKDCSSVKRERERENTNDWSAYRFLGCRCGGSWSLIHEGLNGIRQHNHVEHVSVSFDPQFPLYSDSG